MFRSMHSAPLTYSDANEPLAVPLVNITRRSEISPSESPLSVCRFPSTDFLISVFQSSACISSVTPRTIIAPDLFSEIFVDSGSRPSLVFEKSTRGGDSGPKFWIWGTTEEAAP
jgi:hypothetical protein